MQREGFRVETGFPTITAKQGGRHEADIVGARVRRGKLEICHCEVSEWLNAGGAKQMAIDYAKRKLSPHLCNDVERRFCRKFGLRRAKSYEKIVISKQVRKGFREKLTQLVPNCQVLDFQEFLFGRAAMSIEQWKANNATKSKPLPELPQGLWLMKALEYLFEYQLLSKGSN